MHSTPANEAWRRAAELRVASAALVLGGLLLAATVDLGGRAHPPCPEPHAIAGAGPIVAVRCGSSRDRDAAPLGGPPVLLFGRALVLDSASEESLRVLPGIGPSRARAIVAARSERPFASVADLTRVRGIGPVTVSGLRGWVEPAGELRASAAD